MPPPAVRRGCAPSAARSGNEAATTAGPSRWRGSIVRKISGSADSIRQNWRHSRTAVAGRRERRALGGGDGDRQGGGQRRLGGDVGSHDGPGDAGDLVDEHDVARVAHRHVDVPPLAAEGDHHVPAGEGRRDGRAHLGRGGGQVERRRGRAAGLLGERLEQRLLVDEAQADEPGAEPSTVAAAGLERAAQAVRGDGPLRDQDLAESIHVVTAPVRKV